MRQCTTEDCYARWIYAGDGVHLSAGLLLIGWILRTGTCKGISGRSQTITAIANFAKFAYYVGETPYIPYSICVVTTLALEAFVLLYLILVKYRKTVEKAYDTFWIEVIIIISSVLAIVNNRDASDPLDVIFAGSYYIESVSLLPQIYFNFRTGSKNLCVSSYVLVCSVYKSFHMYYAVTTDQYYTPVSLYPGFVQLATYALYFILLVLIPKHKEKKMLANLDSISGSLDDFAYNDEGQQPVIIVTRPALDRQQSRLEMPFLRKTLPSSSSLTSYVGSHSSSKINSPLVQKKVKSAKLKHVGSTPAFNSKSISPMNLKRTQSASSLVSLGLQSFDSQDEGIIIHCRETATESRQKRIAYARQASLPARQLSSATEITNQVAKENRETVDLENDSTELNETFSFYVNPEPSNNDKYDSKPLTTGNALHNSEDPIGESILTQKNIQPETVFAIHNGSYLDTARKISEPNRSPSSPYNVQGGKRRKRTTSTSPDLRNRPRRQTMHHLAGNDPKQQHNWQFLASTIIGISPPVRRPSSPIHRSDSDDSNRAFHEHGFHLRKKRRATMQALNVPSEHHTSWKTFASSLIGSRPQSPMSAQFPTTSPTLTRSSFGIERSTSDSGCINPAMKQRRATVQISSGMLAPKKLTSWQKFTGGLMRRNSDNRSSSSPIDHLGDFKFETEERKRHSTDQKETEIAEDSEEQD